MSPPACASRAKFHWGITFTTGCKCYTDPETKLRMKHTNRRVRIPKGLDLNNYGFVDHPELQRNEFALHRLPQREGNMNGWLIEDEDEPLEHEASDKEIDSDLESTVSRMVEMVETVGTMVLPAKDSWHAIPRNMIENENIHVQVRGREAAIVSCGTLTKGNEKRKRLEESSK
nr:hypothetical protein [Tanacetum cinerariifolium]